MQDKPVSFICMIHARKKSKRNAAINKLREALGLKQKGLAELLGVSLDTVVSWENGRNRLRREVAHRIFLLTGASIDDLEKGKATLRDCNGETYNSASLAVWQQRFRQDAAKLARNGGDYLAVLLEAADARRGGVYASFVDWLERTKQDFDLESKIEAALRRRAVEKTGTFKVGDLRASPALAQAWGFRDRPSRKDTDTVDLRQRMWPDWYPQGFGGLDASA